MTPTTTQTTTHQTRRYGRCEGDWTGVTPDLSVAVFRACRATRECAVRDMNLVCNTALTTSGEGRCECRRDMRWNSGAGECQLYLDADCSSVTYTSAPSAAVLAAARDLAGRPAAATAVLDRTESYQETLATSLLSRVDANTVTEAELTEAFCRDVDSLSFEFDRQET